MRTEAPNPRSPQAIINIAQTVGSQWPLLVQPAGPDGRPGAAEDVYMVRVHGALPATAPGCILLLPMQSHCAA